MKVITYIFISSLMCGALFAEDIPPSVFSGEGSITKTVTQLMEDVESQRLLLTQIRENKKTAVSQKDNKRKKLKEAEEDLANNDTNIKEIVGDIETTNKRIEEIRGRLTDARKKGNTNEIRNLESEFTKESEKRIGLNNRQSVLNLKKPSLEEAFEKAKRETDQDLDTEEDKAQEKLKEKEKLLKAEMEHLKEEAKKSKKTAELAKDLAEREQYRQLWEKQVKKSPEEKDSFNPDEKTKGKKNKEYMSGLIDDSELMEKMGKGPEGLSSLSDNFIERYSKTFADDGVEAKKTQLTQLKTAAANLLKSSAEKESAEYQKYYKTYTKAYSKVLSETAEAAEFRKKELNKGLKPAESGSGEDRQLHLRMALQVGAKSPDESLFKAAGCNGVDYDPSLCRDRIKKLTEVEKQSAEMAFNLKKQGKTEESVQRVTKEYREGHEDYLAFSEATQKEQAKGCDTSSSGAGFLSTIGSVASGTGSAIATGAKGVGNFFLDTAGLITEHGATFGQGLFPVLSAVAQYQYTRKGSQNSETQVLRGIAMAFGIGLGAGEKLPRGMEKFVDPLEIFKREPVAEQIRISEQDKLLFDTLTMGGDPNKPGAYPYGTHDQLQSILKGTVAPAYTPPLAPKNFPGISDPNYYNFSGQVYNGFPPLQNTAVQGSYLNPQYGSANPYARGSGISAGNQNTLSPQAGLQSANNMLQATSVQRAGVRTFADQLDTLNPPDNSLRSLVDDVGNRSAQNRSLATRSDGIRSLIAEGLKNEEFLRNLRIKRDQGVNERVSKIQALDSQVPNLIYEVRKLHTLVTPDADGLMPTNGRNWSQHMTQLNEYLRKLREITQERAKHIEEITILQRDPLLFEELQKQIPGVPTKKTSSLSEFFISSLWAESVRTEPIRAVSKPVSSALARKWKEMLMEEDRKIQQQIFENKSALARQIPKLKSMMGLDPDGVHEVNIAVVQYEKFNMKAIAYQAEQNLEKLKRGEALLNKSNILSVTERQQTLSNIEKYKSVIVKLKSEATACAQELSRVESLQFEKVKRYEAFQHEKELGQRLLDELAL